MNEKQEKLIKLLEDMFQLNQSDLDFGIYRIMNAKADEIKQFLQKDLVSSIKNVFTSNNNDGLQKELDEAIKQANALGADPESLPKVKELREKLSKSTSSQVSENEIYSYLTNFFSRYYKNGDFVSLRRYKKDTYAIPYEGEEVKLHWANSDQYYIKTSENFRDYTFKTNTHTVHFKLKDADTTTNNNKGDKRVFVYQDHEEIDGELYIYFSYEDGKKHIFPTDIELKKYSLDEPKPTAKNKTRTLLEKHLTDYTAKNSFDYFIHKDLKGFLSRELDFFIKNEILYIDDILEVSSSQIESSLNKIKTFKTIAHKIIAFLSQLEEFQKKLWLKKKFVIDTNYCITLDKIPQKYHEEIFANDAQLREWEELYAVDCFVDKSSRSDGSFVIANEVKQSLSNSYLPIDTKFFSSEFKNRLLSEFENIDEECDGVLINSENFGALNLLQDRYKEQIKTVYIDPPYNTGNDGFLYSDNFQHSSWMSFMFDRLALGRELMSDDGVIFSSIDDAEQNNLGFLLRIFFNKFISNITIHRKRGSDNSAENVSKTHDFLQVFGKTKDAILGRLPLDDNTKKAYKNPLNDSRGDYRSLGLWARGTQGGVEYEYTTNDGYTFSKRLWLVAKTTMEELDADNRLIRIDDKLYRKFFLFENKGSIAQTIWMDVSNNANAADTLKGLFQKISFSTPKPLELIERILRLTKTPIILDFFAGSGTTGHAVINLNREDNGKRKYILVEMGNYFDTVTKPRIQKAIYSDKWKDGKPQDKNGISQMFKYFKLESYEDTLNNLAFKNVDKDLFSEDVKEDYLLNYMLDYETNKSLLNIDTFKTPFDYKLKIASSSAGETVETNVDLVETFNYLIGLKIKTRQMIKGYLVIEGQNLKEENILIIWRNGQSNDELNSFFEKMDFTVYDREFDTIYVNGDNNLANLKKDEEHFKVKLIEEEFKNRMFDE